MVSFLAASAVLLVMVILFYRRSFDTTVWRRSPDETTNGTGDKGKDEQEDERAKDERAKAAVYRDIQPLTDFDWQTTEPLKIYKFKPKYHLTMALENLDFSNLLAVDKTYLERITLRQSLIANHRASIVQCRPVADRAVTELYLWLFGTYLPRRFPASYRIDRDRHFLRNHITHEDVPLHPSSGTFALETIGRQIDTDFLILLPSSTAVDGSPIYHLEAFVTCFPSGFDTSAKLGLPLAEIHAPVPEYAGKIGKSMDRFFARLEVGRVVKRSNWTVTTDDTLFRLGGTHLYHHQRDNDDHEESEPDGNDNGRNGTDTRVSDDEKGAKSREASRVATEIRRRRDEVRPESCRLRCERQTLHRLPESGAIVFAFKTYLYRLDEIRRDASLAEEMAQAIDGLRQGSVPAFDVYKSGVIWGDRVKAYLRREI